MRALGWRQGALALLTKLVVAGLLTFGVLVAAGTQRAAEGSGAPALSQLVPAAAPAGWFGVRLPNRSAVLYYPPTLHRIHGDRDAVSVARLGRGGSYLVYLNATPRQGAERLGDWARFRVQLLRADDAVTVNEDGARAGVAFRGGTGTCVIDDYVTRIGGHHYQELACLVAGKRSASVLVAATAAARWSSAWPLLRQAVAAYRVS